MQIAPRTAERIHSEFQKDKCVPDVKGPLQRERPWLMETVFGKASIKQWVTEHLLTCVAKRQRTTYQSIRDYLREVAPIHIQDMVSPAQARSCQHEQKSLQLRSPPPLGLAVAPFAGQAGQAFAANGGNLHLCLLHWDMWSSEGLVF